MDEIEQTFYVDKKETLVYSYYTKVTHANAFERQKLIMSFESDISIFHPALLFLFSFSVSKKGNIVQAEVQRYILSYI